MSKELALSIYDRMPDPIEAIEKMGSFLAKSGMLGVQTQEQGMVVALTCMQDRITPLEFARTYHIIDGKPSMRADAMQAKFMEAGWLIKWIKSDDKECSINVSHSSHCPDGDTVTLGVADFKEAGILGKKNWKGYPRQMLRARAISEVIRKWDPRIVAGIYTPEETADFEATTVESIPEVKEETALATHDQRESLNLLLGNPDISERQATYLQELIADINLTEKKAQTVLGKANNR